MFAAVFGSATSDETTRPNDTPLIAVMKTIARSGQNIPRMLEDVVADEDEEDALHEREHA